MDISGSYTLHAPREQVWYALLDPDILKHTVPGAESLERTGDNEYAVRMNVGVAGIKGAYRGTLKLLDAQQPDRYRIVVDGTGVRGILHGDGMVRLEAQDSGATVVRYSGQAQLGGTIASVGTQVASAAANMLIKQYFTQLDDLLPTTIPSPVAPALAAASVAAPAPADATPAEAIPTAAPANAPVSQPAVDPEAAPISPATPAEPMAPAEPVAPAAAAMAPPASSTYANGNIASEQTSARTIGAIASIVAIVIVVLVIWLIVSRQ